MDKAKNEKLKTWQVILGLVCFAVISLKLWIFLSAVGLVFAYLSAVMQLKHQIKNKPEYDIYENTDDTEKWTKHPILYFINPTSIFALYVLTVGIISTVASRSNIPVIACGVLFVVIVFVGWVVAIQPECIRYKTFKNIRNR